MVGNQVLFKVADYITGWTNFRPLNKEMLEYLAVAHGCPTLLSSATVNNTSLVRICETVCVPREEVAVLLMDADRPNIYLQLRETVRCLSIG